MSKKANYNYGYTAFKVWTGGKNYVNIYFPPKDTYTEMFNKLINNEKLNFIHIDATIALGELNELENKIVFEKPYYTYFDINTEIRVAHAGGREYKEDDLALNLKSYTLYASENEKSFEEYYRSIFKK